MLSLFTDWNSVFVQKTHPGTRIDQLSFECAIYNNSHSFAHFIGVDNILYVQR